MISWLCLYLSQLGLESNGIASSPIITPLKDNRQVNGIKAIDARARAGSCEMRRLEAGSRAGRDAKLPRLRVLSVRGRG
jgi:hypothetical protein